MPGSIRTLFDGSPRPQIKTTLSWLSCLFLVSNAALSQTVPQIQASGIVNAASYAQPLSPGSIITIFGTNLAASEMTAQEAPLPSELAGTSVLVNGNKARSE